MYRLLFITILLSNCSVSTEKIESDISATSMKYAKGFHFEKDDKAEYLVINEPWPNAKKTLRYDLTSLPKTFICTSTTHLPFFEMLGAEEAVLGFPNVNYVSSKVFIERANQGL